MKISMRELVGRPQNIPLEHKVNLEKTLVAINILRESYGKPLQVTSGYRSLAQHLAIYAAKGITDQSKIPMQSKHLYGQAADLVPVEDPIEHLKDWIMANDSLMIDIGLWFEDFHVTKSWVHAQSVPPKSGNRFFLP